MKARRDICTVGQAATMCGVSPRTVQKWFDAGLLKGFRLPNWRTGQGGDRRILLASLRELAVKQGLVLAEPAIPSETPQEPS